MVTCTLLYGTTKRRKRGRSCTGIPKARQRSKIVAAKLSPRLRLLMWVWSGATSPLFFLPELPVPVYSSVLHGKSVKTALSADGSRVGMAWAKFALTNPKFGLLDGIAGYIAGGVGIAPLLPPWSR